MVTSQCGAWIGYTGFTLSDFVFLLVERRETVGCSEKWLPVRKEDECGCAVAWCLDRHSSRSRTSLAYILSLYIS